MTRDALKQRFGIVGEAPALNQALDVAAKIAPTEVTVLILGENGVGKDAFSRIIHQLSLRKHKPFIAINCGAIPEGTIDSELFGHEKGSFTSAYDSRKGYFEEANGGLIFLDEIAELPLATQARLLRVLENGEYLRVGSSKIQKTDVRVVAATNKNLLEQIRLGKFRQDLYFRLNTVSISVPALRDRGEDLELLFRYFAQEFAQRYGREPLRLSPDAADQLYAYRWPGNIRELRNFAEKVSVLVHGETLRPEDVQKHLPITNESLPALLSDVSPGANMGPEDGQNANTSDLNTQILLQFMHGVNKDLKEIKQVLVSLMHSSTLSPNQMQYLTGREDYAQSEDYFDTSPHTPVYSPQAYPSTAAGGQAYPQQAAPQSSGPHLLEESLSLELKEKDLIIKALRKFNNNRKKAAKELGISERTLYRKIKAYGLDQTR